MVDPSFGYPFARIICSKNGYSILPRALLYLEYYYGGSFFLLLLELTLNENSMLEKVPVDPFPSSPSMGKLL
jgi:hypothetical protein